MKEPFGTLSSGETATLYISSAERISTAVTDYGATLVRLLVHDSQCIPAEVVLGYDDCNGARIGNGPFPDAYYGKEAVLLRNPSSILMHCTKLAGSNP